MANTAPENQEDEELGDLDKRMVRLLIFTHKIMDSLDPEDWAQNLERLSRLFAKSEMFDKPHLVAVEIMRKKDKWH